jgi:hypothetical protein
VTIQRSLDKPGGLMMFARNALLTVTILLCAFSHAATAGQPLDPFVVYGEVARLTSEQEVWPGFSISEMPIAIYDGTNTYLFYHPNPPAGFVQNPDREAIFAYPGRYEAIVANTSMDINGAMTATVMLDSLTTSTTMEAAAVLLHEAFHVYEMNKHPDWAANEADSFTYPVDNAEALALRRLESLALDKALGSFSKAETASWAQLFLRTRQERFALLPKASVAYERGIELMEGTAHYLQYQMLKTPAGGVIPSQEFAADAVRARAYASGRAQCILLDRLFAPWKKMLEQGDAKCLDELLRFAVDVRSDTSEKRFTGSEQESAHEKAKVDVAELMARRLAAGADFEAIPGSLVIIDANARPLFPRGFDPMNIYVLGHGKILHNRFLSLEDEVGKLEVWNHQALTTGAEDNPMFGGLSRIEVRGLGEVKAQEKDGTITLLCEGFSAELRGSLRRDGATFYVTLSPPAS